MFRASQVGALMAYPDKDTLPKGAMTQLEIMVSQQLLDWTDRVETQAMQKGVDVENESINLFNSVFDRQLLKNTERRDNGIITGECDLIDGDMIWDIKSSYSKKTHQMYFKVKSNPLYFWQLVAYCELWGMEKAGLARVLVSTPEHLISKKDDTTWHFVEHIDPKIRISTDTIEVTSELKQQLMNRARLAKNKLDEMIFDRLMNV